ncbi:MAG: cytochrome c oxidase accessory protein CcoG [Azoarcus sp.]|jgi:cytochrome c oxidase accessory protein FixG|nr:cytochrome c oxidase accessory protein CcoG [Azoarcus sp.]
MSGTDPNISSSDSSSSDASAQLSSAAGDDGKGQGAEGLYAAHKKVYVRSTNGVFAKWRWGLVWLTQIIFFGLPWFVWNDRQAFLLHLVERKFYIFGWVFWPQEVLFLSLLLIISAYSLFFFTAIAGRLWCGYACPQTVYTEIFLWIEEKIEGDHNARLRLDKSPMNGRKFAIKSVKYAIWGAFSLWTGFTLVAYFTPVKELLASIPTFGFGPWETFWIFFYGTFTFVFAGFMREQVCKYMCPYARFQSVMFDPDTLIVTYDEARGEPRAMLRKGEDRTGRGDCIDCGICVQVCPTGIDIRQGLQYECIGCGVCIDACDQIMDKVKLPRGLVRYTTENALKRGWGSGEILRHVRRPRTLVYGAILLVIVSAFVWGLATRTPLRFDVIRDPYSLGRTVSGGMVENDYILKVMNMAEERRTFLISVAGLDGIRMVGESEVTIEPTENRQLLIQARVPKASVQQVSNEIYFEVVSKDAPGLQRKGKAVFLLPN